MTGMIRRFAIALFWIALFAAAPTLFANDGQPRRSLGVSLPNGGCTLAILSDGSGRIYYGAAAHTVRVAARTFDFDRIVESLSSESLPWPGSAVDTVPPSVILPGSNEPRLVEDASVVRNLLEQGWRARLPAQAIQVDHERRQHAWVKRVCDFE